MLTSLTLAVCALAVPALLLGVPPLRRAVLTAPLARLVIRALPKLGETERLALEAGTVWWDGDLFAGAPDWEKLLAFRPRPLSETERAFLAGPVEELCGMIDEWDVERRRDLGPEIWSFLRRHRFFGMIIPEEYGGLGFSAIAHSAVVTRLCSRSPTVASTVMVPNALGPAELLLHYGSEEQKRRLLPRLAAGEEIPCFALTEPAAGSDAASIRSEGVVTRGVHEGREVLGMRLQWRKRYITLAPVATLIGLAFRLRDPDRLLGDKEDLGITCALVPAHLPGIDNGRRHDPLWNSFLNGPTEGRDVFVPLDCIVGGPELAGHGWRMLMECLAAGRGISLPASSVAWAQVAVRTTGAYATVRDQFGMAIGRFQGIEEPLARIGGLAYLMDAARVLTAGAIDAGERPAVVSAIVKRYLTEAMRTVIVDAMDIMGGAAICRGPRNKLAAGYAGAPIAVTVEGANILTRSLIVFGQGAMRCHPYLQAEIGTAAARDLRGFDRAFWGHVRYVCRNAARAFWHGITGGGLARPAGARPEVRRHLGRLTRLAAAFSLCADVALATLGGSLKRAERLSGRLADALAWLYLASAAAKRYHDAAAPEPERPFFEWAMRHSQHQIEQALFALLVNLPNRAAAALLRALVFPLGTRCLPPDDRLGTAVAGALLDDREGRRLLTRDMYLPARDEPGLGRLDAVLGLVVAAAPTARKIQAAVRSGALARGPAADLVARAQLAGIIGAEEAVALRVAEEGRAEAIAVDSFAPSDLPSAAIPVRTG